MTCCCVCVGGGIFGGGRCQYDGIDVMFSAIQGRY